MKKNMGSADRIIRILAAIILVVLYFAGTLSGTLGVILLIVAGAFLLTSFIGSCPLYLPLGISTCKKKEQN